MATPTERLSRDAIGAIYAKKLRDNGVTDEALIYNMTKDFLDNTFGPAKGDIRLPPTPTIPVPGQDNFVQGGSMSTPMSNMNMGGFVPGGSMSTLPEARTKDDAYTPAGNMNMGAFVPGGTMKTAVPGTTINSVPPAATVPEPHLRGGAGTDTLRGGPGYDPLPQTSGHTDIVSRSGQESMDPVGRELLARLIAAQRMA